MTSSASQTFIPPNLCLLLLRLPILKVSIVWFSNNLNRLSALSACNKLEPIWQCAEPEFRFYLAKPCSRVKHCTTKALIKITSMKVGCLFNI